MALVLANWGCEVVSAQSLDDLRNKPELLDPAPDALVLDYHLDDDTTGLEAELIVRERLSTSLPTVMITANYSNELRQQVKELGFHLLNKPIKPLKLKSVLVYLLSEK
jgi:CheY-like chemotaxis protein